MIPFAKDGLTWKQHIYFNSIQDVPLDGKDSQFAWIFRDIDYLCWHESLTETESPDGVLPQRMSTLVVTGATISFEKFAAYIIRELPKIIDGTVLYYFDGSTRDDRGEGLGRNSRLVCSMLTQMIDVFSANKKHVQETFLREVLARATDKDFEKLQGAPKEQLTALLKSVHPEVLWSALEITIQDTTKYDSCNTQKKRRHIAFIFDFDNTAMADLQTTVTHFRQLQTRLQRNFRLNLLVTYCSQVMTDLNLVSTEVLLEYDKERQGEYTRGQR